MSAIALKIVFNIKKSDCNDLRIRVKSMQRSGTEAIRTQIQPFKPKREINNITYSQNTREHMVNRVSSCFPKGGHSATETEPK